MSARLIVIDCTLLASEEDFWNPYVETANPEGKEYFGRNLDAFWDAVSAGGPGWPGTCELRFINTDGIKTLCNGAFYESLKKIAQDCDQIRIRVD